MSTNKAPSKKTAFTGPSSTSRSTSVRKNVPPASVDSQSRLKNKSVYGGTSRTILSSSSRKNVQVAGSDKVAAPTKAPVQVFDEEGRDVTPLPLTQADPNAVRQKQSNILADSSAGTPTDLQSQTSLYQTGTVTQSTFGGGPFTRSVFSASQSGRSTGSLTDDLMEPSAEIAGWADHNLAKVKYKPDTKEELTEEDLEKVVEVQLSETDTIWLLDLTGVCVSTESDEAAIIREQNLLYQELVKQRIGNDRYMDRSMETFNDPPKMKNVQTNKISYSDAGVMASGWDMYDSYKLAAELEAKAKAAAEEAEEEAEDGSRPASAQATEEKTDAEKTEGGTGTPTAKPALESQRSSRNAGRSLYVSMVGFEESQATMSSMGATDSVFASKETGVTAVAEQKELNESAILESEDLRKDMVILERAVNLNTYQPKQASYRGFQTVPDVDKLPVEEEQPTKPKAGAGPIAVTDMGPNLDRLWAYQCPLTKGRNVSCISWNRTNPDLLAVGYGQFDFTKQKPGMVCCWSLKNPEYPERVYTFNSGVTSLDFSIAHPNLLAVGLYDGTVAVCNVRSTKDECILDSLKDMRHLEENEASGKHISPVWQLRWIEKERGSGEETAEVLVSISTDGRVTQWSIRKGFESYDLMKLKRIQQKPGQGRTKKTEALISKHAGGLCFDFSAKDSNIYLAGTEEGHIHRCSCSYNEQYLDSYFGHTGPVYHIEWSPFCPDIFLSCSGDWSVRLWHQDRLQPVLNFLSSTKSVPSVAWSPRVATVFACVNEGAVEVWDLSQNTLDPIIVSPPITGVKLSSVTFAKNSDCILVGDAEGAVSVYQLRCMPTSEDSGAEGLQKIVQSSLDSLLQQNK